MTKLDREKCFGDGVPGSGYLWCLHCERAYKYGKYRIEPSQFCAEDGVMFREEKVSQGLIEELLKPMQMCPYGECDGDTVLDGWDWEDIRERHPEYPEVPVEGVVYALYS